MCTRFKSGKGFQSDLQNKLRFLKYFKELEFMTNLHTDIHPGYMSRNNFFKYFCDMEFHILIWKCTLETSVMQFIF